MPAHPHLPSLPHHPVFSNLFSSCLPACHLGPQHHLPKAHEHFYQRLCLRSAWSQSPLRGLSPRCLWEMEISGRDSTDAQSPTLQTPPSMQCAPLRNAPQRHLGLQSMQEYRSMQVHVGGVDTQKKLHMGRGKWSPHHSRLGVWYPPQFCRGASIAARRVG